MIDRKQIRNLLIQNARVELKRLTNDRNSVPGIVTCYIVNPMTIPRLDRIKRMVARVPLFNRVARVCYRGFRSLPRVLDLPKQLFRSRHTVAMLIAETTEVKHKLTGTNWHLDALNQNFQKMFADLSSEVSKLREETKELANKLIVQTEYLSRFGDNLLNIDAASDDVSTSLMGLHEKTDQVSSMLTGFHQKTDDVGTSLTGLHEKTNQVSTMLTGFHEKSDDVSTSLTGLHEKTDQVSSMLTGFHEKTDDVSTSLAGLHEKTDQVSTMLTGFHEKTDDVSTSLAGLHEKTDQVSTMLTGFHEKSDDVSTSLTGLHEKTDSALSIFFHPRLAIKVDPQSVLIRFMDVLIFLPLADWWALKGYFFFPDLIEPGLKKAFSKVIRPGMVVADIGAHIGIYSLLAARLVGTSGKVYSFEPTPDNETYITRSIRVNDFTDRITLHKVAVSDRDGTAKLYINSNAIQNNSFYSEFSGQQCIEVETVSLDNFLDSNRLDVVKIDAEGAEPLILRGMRALVQNNPGLKLFMEFSNQHLQRAGVNVKAWLREIRSDGWIIRQVCEPDGDTIPISDKELLRTPSLNLSLIKTEN